MPEPAIVSTRLRAALSRAQAAQDLGLSLRAVDILIKEKKLRVKRYGKRVLIPQSEINRYLESDDE